MILCPVQRNSFLFSEIIELFKGFKLHKAINNRFYKLFNYLTISIKSVNISIPKSDIKLLIDNIYKPPVNYNGHIIKSMNTGVP